MSSFNKLCTADVEDQLDAYLLTVKADAHEDDVRGGFVSALASLVQSVFGDDGATAISFGSTATRTHLQHADVDVLVRVDFQVAEAVLKADLHPSSAVPMAKQRRLAALNVVSAALTARALQYGGVTFAVDEALVVGAARVPILKLMVQYSGEGQTLPAHVSHPTFECDICINDDGGLANSDAVTQLIDSSKNPELLRDFVILAKSWAKRMGVCAASEGTLSSHALTLMALFFLQQKYPALLPVYLSTPPGTPTKTPGTPTKKQLDSPGPPTPTSLSGCCFAANGTTSPACDEIMLGVLLVSFFEYYGNDFNWTNRVISVRSKKYITKKKKKWHALMCIEEITDPERNICQGVDEAGGFAISDAFVSALETLEAPGATVCHLMLMGAEEGP